MHVENLVLVQVISTRNKEYLIVISIAFYGIHYRETEFTLCNTITGLNQFANFIHKFKMPFTSCDRWIKRFISTYPEEYLSIQIVLLKLDVF
uniref:Uncharacterized protein n=1 Tax=Anguilla anguilla TaxID=7936 RepID=A0A0E9XUP0_ANGAN